MSYPRDEEKVNPCIRTGIGSYAYRYAVGFDGYRPANPMDSLRFATTAERLGADGIQLCENLAFSDNNDDVFRQIREYCAGHEMFVEIGMRDLTDETLARHIQIARSTGSDLIRTVLGAPSDSPEEHPKQLEQRSRSVLRNAESTLDQLGINLGVENHFDLETERLAQIVESTGSERIGFVLDTTNGIGFIERPEQTLERFLPRLLSVHLKDFRIVKVEAGYEIRGCVLGSGWLDYAGILERIISSKRNPSVMIELSVRRARSDSEEETICLEHEMVAASLLELRRTLASLSVVEVA